jgi:RHS repeat-associated protein
MVAINEMPMARRKRELRRVRKTVTNGGLAGNIPNGTTDSIWFGWQTMEERNPSGGTDTSTKQYVWGNYIDECLQLNLLAVAGPQQLAVGVYYPLQDTLYRTMALVNSSGTPVETYDTDAYGNTLIFTGPGADNTWFTDDDTQSSYGASGIIYCGYRYDAETDNYYVRNRYYSPVLGRWLTRDPIGYRGGINLYGYVDSSPVGNVDPSGEATGVLVTGQVIPAIAPGSPAGQGKVVVGVTTGVPGTNVKVGASGTVTTGGTITGSVKGAATTNVGHGTMVTLKGTAKATDNLTKSRNTPNVNVGVKCQVNVPSEGGFPAFVASMNAAMGAILGGGPGQVGPNYSVGGGASVPLGSGLQLSGSITQSFGPGRPSTVFWVKVFDSK